MDRCDWCETRLTPFEREDSIAITHGSETGSLALCGRCLDRWRRRRWRREWRW